MGKMFVGDQIKLNNNIYIYILGIFIEIGFGVLTAIIKKRYTLRRYFKHFRFFWFLFTFYYVLSHPTFIPNIQYLVRNVFSFIFFLLVTYIFFLDFNYIVLIAVTFLNPLFLFYVQHNLNIPLSNYVFFDFIGSFLINFSLFWYKKMDYSNQKGVFYEKYKNENYVNYIHQLIDTLNNMLISLKKDEILFLNSTAQKFLMNYIFHDNLKMITVSSTSRENAELLNLDRKCLKFSQLYNFFTSLIHNDICNQNRNFKEILESIFSSNENNLNFIKYGLFSFKNDGIVLVFEISARKIKDEIVEILIYDITEMKKAEQISIENKYRQKILSKITHEFKTPIIMILTLLQNLLERPNSSEEYLKKYLNHIKNFSNYTIVLICDLVKYVSIKSLSIIKKDEINIIYTIDYCYDILKTLIECNQQKCNKVETKLEIPNDCGTLTVLSNETLLHQILVNLISNSVKFTFSGYILLKIEYSEESNALDIIVEDTGMGIKEEDKRDILKETIEIDLTDDYNNKGTGIGLSICQNLAIELNHTIRFESTLGKGSIFYLRLEGVSSKKKEEIKSIKRVPSELRMNSSEFINSNSIILPKEHIRLKDNNEVYDGDILLIDCEESEELTIKKDVGNSIIPDTLINEMAEEDKNFDKISFFFTIGNCNIEKKSMQKFVIIDDHKLVRENTSSLLKKVLKSLGVPEFEILEGTDGIDLLNLLRNDVDGLIKYIFIDENMEYLNGSEAVSIVRKLEEKGKIKKYQIASLTAFDDNDTKCRIIKAGINRIIPKPCTKTDLTNILTNILYET